MTILELDVGNTRIKWRRILENGSKDLSEGVSLNESEFASEQANFEKPKIMRFCNVRGEGITQRILDWGQKHWNLDPVVARVRRECGGVKINYPDVSCLGVDRWLAMLSAFKKSKGACIVVDSGTAFTLDVLNAEGVHLGGYILPGLDLMKNYLIANTNISLDTNVAESSIRLGNSTDEAVLNGSSAALVALIHQSISNLLALDLQLSVFFSGGDGKKLMTLTDFAGSRSEASLVLDGLAIGCTDYK